jgi:hypothetical protein
MGDRRVGCFMSIGRFRRQLGLRSWREGVIHGDHSTYIG